MQKKIIILIIAFSILGMLNSTYLTYLHYSKAQSKICTTVGNFQCDVVNQSVFSELTGIFEYFGIPIYLPVPQSVMGFGFFLVILGISILLLHKKSEFKKIDLINVMLILSVIGLLFAIFLVYIEAFVLRAWCLFCLIMDVIVLSILILTLMLKKSKSN